MNLKAGDKIHITQWFDEANRDHYATVTTIGNLAIHFEPPIMERSGKEVGHIVHDYLEEYTTIEEVDEIPEGGGRE